ncbi:MAG: hypothetical protein ACI87E_000911 [Mariniblastus sp.]|jgi:hypothetical protein
MNELQRSLSDESKANLRFAAKIATTLSVGYILGAIYTGFVAYRDIRALNATYGN